METNLLKQILSEQGATVALLGVILFVLWKAYRDLANRLFNFMAENQKVIVNNSNTMSKLSESIDRLGRERAPNGSKG